MTHDAQDRPLLRYEAAVNRLERIMTDWDMINEHDRSYLIEEFVLVIARLITSATSAHQHARGADFNCPCSDLRRSVCSCSLHCPRDFERLRKINAKLDQHAAWTTAMFGVNLQRLRDDV